MPLTNPFRASAAILVAIVAAAALLAVVLLLISHKHPASALGTTSVGGTIITVTTDVDESKTDNDCSLREAIEAANTNGRVDRCAAGDATQRDAIHFSIGQEATITLGSQLPTITDAAGLKINGMRQHISISGDDSVRVFEVGSVAKLTLDRVTVADGFDASAGGGLANSGSVKVTHSTFSGNAAGGVNPGAGGGIYSNSGSLTVINSTFSGNSASGGTAAKGGGIYSVNGPLTVVNSTFSGNSAGDGVIFADDATLRNTIMAKSPSGGNCGGTVTDAGYNIDDGTTCGFSAANNSQPSTNPLLDPNGLADNGGPTKTIKLMQASPAKDGIPRGTNGCGSEVSTDQRRVARPQGARCDIGSFEKSSPHVSRVVPKEDARGVAPSPNILAFFSEEMSETSVNEDTFKVRKAGAPTAAIEAKVEYVAERNEAILNPKDNLELGVRYRATVSTGAKSVAGYPLDQDKDPTNGNQPKMWFFTVRSN